jgi:hypothetical protein
MVVHRSTGASQKTEIQSVQNAAAISRPRMKKPQGKPGGGGLGGALGMLLEVQASSLNRIRSSPGPDVSARKP